MSETCEVRESSETWERESLGTSAITAVDWHHSSQTQLLLLTVVSLRAVFLFQSLQSIDKIPILISAIWLFRRRFRNTLPRTEAAPSRRLTKIQIQCDSCLSCTRKGPNPLRRPLPPLALSLRHSGSLHSASDSGHGLNAPPRPARDRGEAGRRSRIRPAAGRCMTFRGAATCQRRRWRRPWPRPRQPGRRAGHRGPARQGRTRRARRSRRRAARRA